MKLTEPGRPVTGHVSPENGEAAFSIRQYRPADENAVLNLIQQGMGGGPIGKRDEAFWRWKHFDNPFGNSIAMVAEDRGGQIIGLRTLMRWRFKAGEAAVNAVRAVDTVTHPEYRRYGVFSVLTREAVRQARESGIDLIFNTPNNQVLPGYLKLGWDYVAMVRPLVKVLNYPRFVGGMLRHRNGSRASGQLALDEVFRDRPASVTDFLDSSRAVERLLDSCRRMRTGRLLTERSVEYLRWRYAGYPGFNYVVVYEHNGEAPAGGAILRTSTRFGLKEVIIVELLLPGPDEAAASSLLNELRRRVNADYLIAYFPEGSFERRILRRHGFHQVPRGGQNLTVNVLTGGLPCDARVLGNWDISLGDLEVF